MVDAKSATDEVIDTSDAEERELIEAEKPEYHQNVWGSTKDLGGVSHMEVDSDVRHIMGETTGLTQLGPRTPVQKNVRLMPYQDPSPTFSRLNISPQNHDPLSTTPPTTDICSMSGSGSHITPGAREPSMISLSPPGPSYLKTRKLRSRMSTQTPLPKEFDYDNNSSQDPISLLTPLPPRKTATNVQTSRRIRDRDRDRSPIPGANSPTNVTYNLPHGKLANDSPNPRRYPSSPLGFPHSPIPSLPSSSLPFFPVGQVDVAYDSKASDDKKSYTPESATRPSIHSMEKITGNSSARGESFTLEVATAFTPKRPANDISTPALLLLDSPLSPIPGPLTPAEHVAGVHDRFRSLSLTPPPPARPSSHRISPTPSPSAAPASPPPPIIIPPDPDPPGRAYSLRHRSAMQLNPFAYEKKMYKLQLKGVPEAIVKDPNVRHEGQRKQRYREIGEESDGGEERNWSSGAEGNDDGDEDWRRRERRREKQKQKEAAEQRLRELGLMPSSSEDGQEILPGVEKVVTVEDTGAERYAKKRKSEAKIRKFPMAAPDETEGSFSRRNSSPATRNSRVEPPPRPRPRPQPIFRGSSPAPAPSTPDREPSASTSTEPMDLDSEFKPDAALDDADMYWPDTETGAREGERATPIVVDDGNLHDAQEVQRKRRLKRGRLDYTENDPDVQILKHTDHGNSPSGSEDPNSNSESSSPIEMTEKDRKRLKALRHMMPAAHAKRLLHEEQKKARQKARVMAESDEDGTEEDVPLQPGRGKKRIVSPGSRDPKRYEIKGDLESESESPDSGVADHEVIVVNDDSSEEDAELALEESDDGIDDGDIQTWLAPKLQDASGQICPAPSPAVMTRRSDHERDKPCGGDLIDRMLQRTRRVGPREARPAAHRKLKVRGPRNPTLNIVTKDARMHGAGRERQSKLAFPRKSKRSISPHRSKHRENVSAGQHQDHRIEPHLDLKSRRHKKHKQHGNGGAQTHLYIVPANGRRVVSGRGRQVIHFDDNDDAFFEALAPVGRHESHKARPRAKDGAQSKNMDVLNKFRDGTVNTGVKPDAFDGHRHSQVTLDFDIHPLPSGITFGPESYTGKGRLYDLISVLKGESATPRPLAVAAFGQQVDPDVPAAQLSDLFAAVCDCLYDISTAAGDTPEMLSATKSADAMMHSLCQMVSFRALHANDEEDSLLATAVSEQTDHLVKRIDERLAMISADGHNLDHRSFALYWFSMELQLRLAYGRQNRNDERTSYVATQEAERFVALLIRRLLEYGLDRTMQPLQNQGGILDIASRNVRTLELWSSVLHLAPLFQSATNSLVATPNPFWRLVDASMEMQSNKPDSQLDASERIWRTLFSLCAISQFSLHGLTTSTVRLTPYWPMVSKALGCIRLNADEQLDHSKSASTLQKRDAYVRLVTLRCFLLCIRWNWRLNDADDVFRDLCAIFRSRKFSNLLGEPSDFPTFIRDQDEALYHVYKKGDTAFGLFLKLIIRAAKDFSDADDAPRIRSIRLGKLLSLAVPVGSTSFTKASPPVGQDLSMLYNRYSAIIVAIYVEPTSNNICTRLQQIRRYVTFKDADCNSRAASIRAMMNVAILLRHLDQPLEDVLSWASEMMHDLIESYKAVETSIRQQMSHDASSKADKDQIILSIQMLLGSIRLVTETHTMNRSENHPVKYPDIGFLQGPWITSIFTPSLASLASDHRTGVEIRKCVLSFLAARNAVIPPPPLPKPSADQQESQESQDEYGDGGLDLNDPAVLALLHGLEGPPDGNCTADKKAGPVMSKLSVWIYRLLIKYIKGDAFDPQQSDSSYEGDQWIECWLGCASIAVRHNERDWDFYFTLGTSVWKDIHDSFWRRRVRLRFMLTVLQLDPAAYHSHTNNIFEVWFESLVTRDITIEHNFTARLLAVDGRRHFLFRNVPYTTDPDTGSFDLHVLEFEQLRPSLIDAALCNIAEGLEKAEMAVQALQYIPFIESMIKILRECFQSVRTDSAKGLKLAELCKNVFAAFKKHPILTQEPRLKDALDWGHCGS